MVFYVNGLIERIDFNTPDAEEPLDSFQVPNEEEGNEELQNFTDADMFDKSDENIVLCFLDSSVAFFNARTKSFTAHKNIMRGTEDCGVLGVEGVFMCGMVRCLRRDANKEYFTIYARQGSVGFFCRDSATNELDWQSLI